jgi:hypothetical protein
MVSRAHLWGFVAGALAYYGYARYRGVIDGAPWAPIPATNVKRQGA